MCHRVELILPAYQLDMRAHCGRSTHLVAAHDGDHHAVVFGVRLCQPPEIAELGATERLHPHPRRQGHLGDVAVLRAGIDRVVELLVDFMEPFGIAGIAQHPQLFVDAFQLLAIRRGHPFGGKACADRFELRHRLEHAGQPLNRRLRHHRAAMSAGFDEAARHQLAQRLAYRRPRHVEAPRDIGFIQPRSRRQHAAHDFVGKLQPQLLRTRHLVPFR